jgi:hypothetical protein
MHTIVYYETASSPPLVVGRPEGGSRRGKATLQDDLVIVSPLEYWAADGLAVFSAFYSDTPLAEEFTLRDPRQAWTSEAIQDLLGRGRAAEQGDEADEA